MRRRMNIIWDAALSHQHFVRQFLKSKLLNRSRVAGTSRYQGMLMVPMDNQLTDGSLALDFESVDLGTVEVPIYPLACLVFHHTVNYKYRNCPPIQENGWICSVQL